ncbi:tripartite motif-containing protein 16-like isoform X1 [Xyrichtys novacula]|uniref:Tripartite motif-containing protein 16-like isoform X1 n=1 Tax=Xyrichtys novacula TaxID=13765 RepID=A0AAV1FRG5_XYRNO|nr:tripartite motif-containing protein 16-like isoform X1 [Xyrichtys novacula]
MAQQGIQFDRENRSCSVCLDLLKDPVTIPCGHSYCMSCISDCWDEEKDKDTYSCPQCRKTFTQRPVLVKNTILAELVEEVKKVKPQAASPDLPYAGPEDMACDYCSGKRLKALKSCLVCMASYCEQHLQPHYSVALLKKHKLVEATFKLQENICSHHEEVMKIYCRTDHKCICSLCSVDEHKGHDMVSAAAETAEKQKELKVSQQKIQQRVQDRKRDIKVLQQRVEAFNLSADEAVKDSEKTLTELISLIEKICSEVTQQIRSQQKTQVTEATELEEKLQQEITDLRRKDAELEKLSQTEDHLHFLNNYPSLSGLNESTGPLSISVCPLSSFKDVTAAVSKLRDKLQAVLSEDWVKISSAVTKVEVLPPQPEPTTRADFMRYSRSITLDPNTAQKQLLLSDSNKKATQLLVDQLYPSHPDRFILWRQVLSKDGLTGRCYWEVKWSGYIIMAVAYKEISRTGTRDECGFGFNEKSWSLECRSSGHIFRHNNIETAVSGPPSSTIGVYLDHQAGTLSYYRVSDTMTLLHRVQTTFTLPLYSGFWLPDPSGSTAEICELK